MSARLGVRYSPSDQLAQDAYNVLLLVDVASQNTERADFCAVCKLRATWCYEATNNDELEQLLVIFANIEVIRCILEDSKIAFPVGRRGYSGQLLDELVAEDCAGAKSVAITAILAEKKRTSWLVFGLRFSDAFPVVMRGSMSAHCG